MKIRQMMATTGLTVLGLVMAGSSLAESKPEIDKRVSEALTQFEAMNPANSTLMSKSAGMLVFPHVTKGGVGVAAEHGDGVLQINGKTVGYYSVSAASVGLTLGIAQHSEIIMFMTKDSLDKFRATKGWSIGADAGITVVKVGANGQYDSKIEQKPILAFQFGDKGLLGDLSVEGEKISKIKTPK
jgi:lipid-binding SYLF domain-containing protein